MLIALTIKSFCWSSWVITKVDQIFLGFTEKGVGEGRGRGGVLGVLALLKKVFRMTVNLKFCIFFVYIYFFFLIQIFS